ncbi:MAG: ROK family protein [Hyphomicrobiaceae bacterium]
MTSAPSWRIGVDLGGTKIEALALAGDDTASRPIRVPTPRGDYQATLDAVARLVADVESACGTAQCSVGVGIPGSVAPATGLVQNANSTWLNGRPFERDLAARLARPVRTANDANCFALSEAIDGAAAGAGSAFGVILGTGCGGGFVVRGTIVDGPRSIGGEWGHNPLPWPTADEVPGPRCWCGRHGCMETWVCGPALVADHLRVSGVALGDAGAVAVAAAAGDAEARATMARHADRLARGLATVVNILDPEVIVLGGGLSGIASLYEALPGLMMPHLFTDVPTVDIRPPRWGDASGVRGAARLWAAGA